MKELLIVVAKQVEETQGTVIQYQLFEEVGKDGEPSKDERKLIVHINCKTPSYSGWNLSICKLWDHLYIGTSNYSVC